VTDLSQPTGRRLSTSSTMVGQLSRTGLLNRVEDDDDRRRTIVHLPRGYRSCQRVGSRRWRWPWPELRACGGSRKPVYFAAALGVSFR
jgi:hypothetical protein